MWRWIGVCAAEKSKALRGFPVFPVALPKKTQFFPWMEQKYFRRIH